MENQADNLNFKSLGQDVIIWPLAKIVCPEVISIGNSVIIDDFVFFMGGKETALGSFIHIGAFTSIAGGGKFIMEDFSGLSGGVRIYTGNEDYQNSLTNPTVPAPYRNPIRSFIHIKKHAGVGANSVVLPGVTIGEGAIVGANSLVTKDCEPWKVYVGSPAKPIKNRNRQRILELESQFLKEVYDENGVYISKNNRNTLDG